MTCVTLPEKEVPVDHRETLKKLSKDEIIDVMMIALDYMNQYNGRTRTECIRMALGIEEEDGS